MHSKSPAVAALKAAFPHTIPIFAGFLFLGMTYGVYMRTSGFSFWYPMIMSVVIFGGSLEFVATSMLLAPFAPVQVFLTAVMIQARHLFYGISMLDKYKGTGWKKPYLIYAMCDETFSVNYTAEIPEGVDRGWFYFFVSLLDEFYWFLGATLGGVLMKADSAIKKYLGPTLIPQAGVAIGLTLVAQQVVPEHAQVIRAVVLCATFIYEIIGPAVAKLCLVKAGEIKTENA